jgi:hypothetical protein
VRHCDKRRKLRRGRDEKGKEPEQYNTKKRGEEKSLAIALWNPRISTTCLGRFSTLAPQLVVCW